MSLENFGILHGLCNTKNSDEVVGKAFESATKGQLISHLKKQENYLKVSDKKVSDKKLFKSILILSQSFSSTSFGIFSISLSFSLKLFFCKIFMSFFIMFFFFINWHQISLPFGFCSYS